MTPISSSAGGMWPISGADNANCVSSQKAVNATEIILTLPSGVDAARLTQQMCNTTSWDDDICRSAIAAVERRHSDDVTDVEVNCLRETVEQGIEIRTVEAGKVSVHIGDVGHSSGHETTFSISVLMLKLAEINMKARDREREFQVDQQNLAFKKMQIAMAALRDAVELNHTAEMKQGVTEMMACLVSFACFDGGTDGTGKEIFSTTRTHLADKLRVIGSLSAAGDTRQAESAQAFGDAQLKDAENVKKGAETSSAIADEASRRMHETTQDLTRLHGQIASVRFYK